MTTRLGELDVSRETFDRLILYADLVRKWNPRINLVSRKSLDDMWQRHFVDSAQLFGLTDNFGDWLDIGSGGGFPGLVIAILSKEMAPSRHVTLIESDRRKAVFLKTAAREIGVHCTVHTSRIEETPPQNVPILSARALSSLTQLLSYAERHLDPDGVALFPKGESWENEVAAAKEQWSFRLEKFNSWTEPSAAILRIRDISRV